MYGKKHSIGVFSDKYYSDKDAYKDDPFCDYDPIDMNGGLVQEKGENDLDEVEDNIRERFSLTEKEE